MSLQFTVGISHTNGTQRHSGGARRPDSNGGSHRNESIFGQKPDFGPNASRNHGRHYGLELDSLSETRGLNRTSKHHKDHGSERFAKHEELGKKHNGGKIIGGILGALAGGLAVGTSIALCVLCPFLIPALAPMVVGSLAVGTAVGLGVGKAIDKGADKQENKQLDQQIYHSKKSYDFKA